MAAEYEGEIYIGADDGKIHKFKTEDKFGMKAFSDNGSAYPCVWTTKMDTLSDCSSYKTIPKGNVGVLFKPSAGTAGEIFYITEEEKKVRDFSLTTVFDFGSIDFDNFSFGSSVNPTFIATNSKVRKAKMFQIAVKNNTVDTDMGIFEIKFNYIIKNRIK